MLLPSKREVFTIGIFGSNGKTSTASILCSIFRYEGLDVETISTKKNGVHKRNMTNNEVFKLLKSHSNSDIIIVEISENFLKNGGLDNIDFNMLIHCHISDDSYENSTEGKDRINSTINFAQGVKTVILNTDDTNWKNISNIENTYLITYGLGSKATVTASSIECGKAIRFCYCIQRYLTSFKGYTIEPMEVPFLIKIPGQYNVYNSLAAITAALVYGISLKNIMSSLCNNISFHAGLKILYENGFSVIDNICNNLLSYESGFEAIQNLPYENINLIFNLDSNKSEFSNSKVLEVIVLWALTLKFRNVYFLSKDDYVDEYNYFINLKNALEGSDINIIRTGSKLVSVEGIINSLSDNDMLLFFCSSELNYIREKLTEMLDKRILGSLS